MRHFASPDFWKCFDRLPPPAQTLARTHYERLKGNPDHPSLHFKKIGRFRSVRIGLRYRALGVAVEHGVLWFWIGSHAEYDKMINR